MEDPDSLTELFRRSGLKVTPQRQCIFRILHANPTHSTAEEIYAVAKRQMPTLSLKTVYETLHSLAALGQIQQIDLGTRSFLFDPDVDRHHHLVCSTCGRIQDVDLDLAPIAASAAEEHGYVLGQTEVILRGICPTCVTNSGS